VWFLRYASQTDRRWSQYFAPLPGVKY